MDPGRLRPNPLGLMDIGDKHLLRIIRRPQERWLLAIAGIDTDPCEPQPPGPRLPHDIQSVLAFRRRLACALRHPGLIAPRRVLDPTFRQIKPHVHWHVPLAVRQHPEHRNLTIVHLAQAPRPLPRHAPTERSPCLGKLLSSMIRQLLGLPPSRWSTSWLICTTAGSWFHGELLMKCWNCCAQPCSTTAAIPANRQSPACASPCR